MFYPILKTFHIKPYERGILYYRGVFQSILTPGTHRRIGTHWSVALHDLSRPEAQLDHLEFLIAEHSIQLNAHITIVQTKFDEVALVQQGQEWLSLIHI